MKLAHAPMTQLAWVVEDIEMAEKELATGLAGVRWTRLESVHFGPEGSTYRGAPADFVAHISLGYVGELQLELIQPVRGESIYSEFLFEHGPGLHHACWEVDDIATALGDLTPVQAGSMAGGDLEFAYVDLGLPGIPLAEFVRVGPGMRAFFNSLKETS
ncbi:hypothetical protein Back2_23440 [Nocardioides baekrokdamisoli]|uniref:Lactoylglutathione lyase n=2 Tax=Nocardioides baekrokdamisoli TaxID=1804624 RepID=A0A3G9IGE4_9ACTN|nr:hypothetical protein Back2_23440 [Nocardioides baekrokdamisoli]